MYSIISARTVAVFPRVNSERENRVQSNMFGAQEKFA